MKNIILLGGNGYIGRHVTEKWIARDNDATFYVISRSGKNKLENPRIKNLRADVTDYQSVKSVLPEKIDCIVDFVGRPEKDQDALNKINRLPAEVMLKVAKEYNVDTLGFVGGILGPKSFVEIKSQIITMLKGSGKKIAYVEPTLVYGDDRKDTMTKMVPILKFFGIFSKNLRPVHINDVANELVDKLTK